MLPRLPIHVTAATLIGLPVLIVGVLLSVMWNDVSREAVTGQAVLNLKNLHSLTTAKVNDLLSMPPRICKLNERFIVDGVLDPEDLHSWRSIYINELSSFEILSSIVWGSADGRALWVARYTNGDTYWAVKDDPAAETINEWRLESDGAVSEEFRSIPWVLFDRPWFKSPCEAGGPAWTEPFVWAGGDQLGEPTLGISYGIPIYHENGTLHGVVDADLSLNDLSDFLSSINTGRGGVSTIVDGRSRILAASKEIDFISPEGERHLLSESSDLRVRVASTVLGGENRVVHFSGRVELDGSVFYMQITPVGNELGLHWSLISVLPEQSFIAAIDSEFRQSFYVSLMGVVLAILMGIVSARWLVSPIRTLVESVRRIGQGDLQTRVHIRHSPEYVELSNAVNDMASGLQDTVHMRERLEATTQSMLDGIVAMDHKNNIVEFNKAAEDIFGYTREEVINQPLSECIIPPELRKAHAAGVKHYKATGDGPVLNTRIEILGMRKDGSTFPIELTIVPFDFEGQKHFTATIRDVTEQKKHRDEVESLRSREDMLRRELDHRVKNMLAQILSLSRQTADRAGGDKPMLDSLVGKIASLSSVHELLGESGQDSVSFKELFVRCCGPYMQSDSQLVVEGNPLFIRPQAAMCLSLVCNELANNSRKHGALTVDAGNISVSWRIEDECLHWNWTERGGPAVSSDICPSFGMQMLESLIPYELNGEVRIQWNSEGFELESVIPLENIAAVD
jgi:PAS domain S-box-containing protein